MKVMFALLCISLGSHATLHNLPCTPMDAVWNLEELERVLFNVAKSKGVYPTVILNRLLRKYKTRQRLAKNRGRNPLQQIALTELFGSGIQVPPLSTNSNPMLPPPPPSREKSVNGGGIRMTPDGSRSHPRPPDREQSPVVLQPDPFSNPLFLPVQSFKPPPGVTIRVNGAATSMPEVTVTISPMMTVLEALRQADFKFRKALGIKASVSADEVMNIMYSPYAGCYILNSFYDIITTDRVAWKIIVYDGRGEVIYDSICLPSRNEVPVKPGTTILLAHSAV